MSTPTSPAAFIISETTSDGLRAFLFSILLIDFLAMHLSIKQSVTANSIYLKQIIHISCKLCVQKFLVITIPNYFLIFITDCRYTIIISYAMPGNHVLISVDHPFCNLKHIAFLVIPTHPNIFISALHLACKQPFLAFFIASKYVFLLVFPCFHSFDGLRFYLILLLTSSFHYEIYVWLGLLSVHNSYL